jgi:hypothetical protein
LLKNSKGDDRERCENNVKQQQVGVVVYGLTRKPGESLEVEESQTKCYVLVEEVTDLAKRI